MEEAYRKRLLADLERLRQSLEADKAGDTASEADIEARFDALEATLEERDDDAESLLGRVRDDLLEWEVEHPRLAALLHRVSSALEGVGL